jgi:nitroreductase
MRTFSQILPFTAALLLMAGEAGGGSGGSLGSRAGERTPATIDPQEMTGAGMIALPAPSKGGMPLMEALAARHTSREFAPQPLSRQQLADLLWAACGINRPEEGKRTAPSARNWQEVDVYVVLPEGVFLYLPEQNGLRRVVDGDHRAVTGVQDFCATAPLDLVFVADTERMIDCPPELVDLYSGADTAFMAQNVYLYCAANGLNCVVRGSVDRGAIHQTLGLRPPQKVTLGMTIGQPPEGTTGG